MALSNQDRVLESSTTTGVGTYTLAGAVTGFQSFAIVGNGNTVQYSAWEVDASGNPSGGWENGLGTYTASGTTLARTTIYTSSNSNAAVSWSAGTRYIACSPLTEGTLVVRQPGGTVGTDEVQIAHTGALATYTDRNASTGSHRFLGTGSDAVLYIGSGSQYLYADGTSVFVFDNGAGRYDFQFSGSTRFQFFNNGAFIFSVFGLGFIPLASTVMAPCDTSAVAGGWLQNTSGEASLESAFTRSDATLTSTNISFPVVAGRSYRITGYLIVSNSVAGEGAKFDFDGGTATRTTFDVTFNAVGGTVVPGTISATALDTDLNYTSVTGTTRIFVQGYLEVNAGGTFILRASEDTTATGTMTLAAGSWLALYDTVDR